MYTALSRPAADNKLHFAGEALIVVRKFYFNLLRWVRCGGWSLPHVPIDGSLVHLTVHGVPCTATCSIPWPILANWMCSTPCGAKTQVQANPIVTCDHLRVAWSQVLPDSRKCLACVFRHVDQQLLYSLNTQSTNEFYLISCMSWGREKNLKKDASMCPFFIYISSNHFSTSTTGLATMRFRVCICFILFYWLFLLFELLLRLRPKTGLATTRTSSKYLFYFVF